MMGPGLSPILIALLTLVVSGLIAAILGRTRTASSAVGAAGVVGAAVLALPAVFRSIVRGTTEHFVAEWSVPFGQFALKLDPLVAWFALPLLVLTALAAVYGVGYLAHAAPDRPVGRSWFFFNGLIASMLLVLLAENGILFLFAWELMTLASFFLVTFDDGDESVRAAGRQYLIASALGTAFLLAFFLLASGGSSMEFGPIRGSTDGGPSSDVLFLLALVGFGTKAGLMPFHVWLPEAHPAAPSHVSAVMSGVMVKTGIYGLFRTLSLLPEVSGWWAWALIGLGSISGIWGLVLALSQQDLKRLLAYSTVENVGIITIGLGVGVLGIDTGVPLIAILGFSGALLHVGNHGVFKTLLFLGSGAVLHATGTRRIDELGGLAKRMPWIAAAFVVGSVAIVGLPPLNGFAGEFLIYLGALRGEEELGVSWAVPTLLVIGSLGLIGGLAAAAFAKVDGIVFLGTARTDAAKDAHPPGPLMTVPIVGLAVACIGIGLAAPRVVALVTPIAERVAKLDPGAVPPGVVAAEIGPVSAMTTVGIVGAVIGALLFAVRSFLLSRREVGTSGTWGCGYAAPTPRMQYTGSSFADPILLFFRPILRERRVVARPRGFFPQSASSSTATSDPAVDLIYGPSCSALREVTRRSRWIQGGRTHVYILYTLVTLLALLAWFLSGPSKAQAHGRGRSGDFDSFVVPPRSCWPRGADAPRSPGKATIASACLGLPV